MWDLDRFVSMNVSKYQLFRIFNNSQLKLFDFKFTMKVRKK